MNEPKKPLVLTIEQRRSTLWRALMDQWTERLQSLRQDNDRPHTESETAALRGRIAELKACMLLDQEFRE